MAHSPHAVPRRLTLPVVLVGIVLLNLGSPALAQRDAFVTIREQMVTDHLAGEGIKNEAVLKAMRQVPRHLFVRSELRAMAYYDQAMDIGHRQTISPPFIVAYMTEVLDPQPTDRVLEIGTGSGYQAAVLSGLVKDVYTIEIVEPLGKNAAALLKRLKYDNVHCRVGDGYLGWPEAAPFDKIIVTCSPEDVPAPLVEQLKDGGRMIIPLGERYQQVFHLLEKKDGVLKTTKLLPTLFVPMTGDAEEQRDIKPDPLHPALVNGGFEKSLVNAEKADNWHYQRRSHLGTEDAFEGKQYLCFENTDAGRSAHVLQGLAIDGSKVPEVRLSVAIKTSDIKPGEDYEKPGLVIHFFDGQRLPLATASLGPWLDDYKDWEVITKKIPVPKTAREAIVQVGLNGARGMLCLDALTLSAP